MGQNEGGGEVAEREGQNHGETPDADNDPRGGLGRQAGLQRVDDGHVPADQRTVGLKEAQSHDWFIQEIQENEH